MVDKNALTEQLRKLKKKIQDDPQVRALYDLDNDGRISGQEWDKAREEVIRFMEVQEAHRENPAGESSAAAGAAGMAMAGAAGAADHVFEQIRSGTAKEEGASGAAGTLLSVPEVIIDQQVEGLELMTDFEGCNRYRFTSPEGRHLASAQESDTGVAGFISRSFFASRRPFTMGISVLNTPDIIWLKRRFELIFSRIDVKDNEHPVGVIQQRFGLINRKYTLYPNNGRRNLTIRGPLFKPWTFYVLADGRQVGLITKKWSGFFKEALTRADSFVVRFEDSGLSVAERMLILGTAVAIDIDYFEQSQN